MNRRHGVLVPVVAILAIALGACGGDDSDDSGASGSPIVIQQIAPQDNPVQDLTGMTVVADAAAKWINSSGGINGRRVVVKHCNDQLNPNKAQACAQQAISDEVVAVVGSFTNFGPNVLPALQQAEIPYVAGYLGSPADYTNPIVFAVGNAGSVGTAAAVAKGIEDVDPSRVNQISIDLAAGQAAVELLAKDLEALDIPVGSNTKVSPTATDYAPFVSQAVKGADVVAPTLAAAQFLPFATALEQSAAKVKVATAAGLVTNKVVEQTGGASGPLEGMIVGSAFPALSDPAWDDYKEAVAKYASDDESKAVLEQNQEQSVWVSMMAFAQVAKTVEGDLTGPNLLDAFNKASDVEVEGLTPPLEFAKPFQVSSLARLANRWVFPLTVKNGEIAPTGDGKPVDVTDLLVKANGS